MQDDPKVAKFVGQAAIRLLKAMGAEVEFPEDPDHYVVRVVPRVPPPPPPPIKPDQLVAVELRFSK